MDLKRPLDLSRDKRHLDGSGTPTALIELARQRGELAVVDHIDDADVLIEFPMGPIWQRETECDRFVRLRSQRGGKRYALVRHEKPPDHKAPPKRRRKIESTSSVPLLPYAEDDSVGAKRGLEGAGIMAYMSGDQMHPPMIDDAECWRDASKWPEAAAEHTRAAARMLNLQPGERVLDIGCGIGGPARLLVDEFNVEVYGVANSSPMIRTASKINEKRLSWRENIEVALHDCQNPYSRRNFDVAWSMNMLYVVADKDAMLVNIRDALRPGGRLLIEDWMLTDHATDTDRIALRGHFIADTFAEVNSFTAMLEQHGLRIVAHEDLGYIGRTHLAAYHHDAFNSYVRPQLEADFPAPPGKGTSGKQMADEWIAGIDETIRLYRAEKLTYLRLLAVLSESGH